MNKKELLELLDIFRNRKIESVRERQGKEALRMKVEYVNHLPGIKAFQAAYEAFDSALLAIAEQIPESAHDRWHGIFRFIDHREFIPSAKDKVMGGIRYSGIIEFDAMYSCFANEIEAINQEYAKLEAYCKTLRDGKAVREYLVSVGFDVPEDKPMQLPATALDVKKLF